jgi:AcrR family transcriptional regulator
MAGQSAPPLSRERIRAAALAIVDEAGLEGLSMRKLATSLGVSAPSLYFHYSTKDELVDDLVGEIFDQVDTSDFEVGWREGLMTWARSYRAAIAQHPNIVPYLAHGPGVRESSLQNSNNVHAGLTGAGWPERDATMIGASVKYLVVGSATGSFSRGFIDDPALYADRFPALRGAHRLRRRAEQVDREAFEFALASFIDGLELRLSSSRPRQQP